MAALRVWFERRPVGRLEERNDGMTFAYDPAWLDARDSFAISLSLPLEGPIDAVRATRFFANLLPEANVRTLLSRRLGLSETNDFALLAAIGGECAGALTILPEGDDPAKQRNDYEELDRKRLKKIATGYDALPTVDGSGRSRLSLAGAQDKLPVRIDGERILLPLGNSPSTHILKLANRNFKHLPANEALVMALARGVGLPAVSTTWRDIGDEGMCVVERYDRVVAGDAIRRLHQEDFCQAMGLPVSRKYEEEGGPTVASCVTFIRENSVDPLSDVDAFLRWTAFNAVVGNADAHGKNVSFVLRNGRRLAPFYDLVCTRAYDGLDRHLAMSIGGERDPDRLREKDLGVCARALDIKARFLHAMFEKMADAVISAIDEAVSSAGVAESPAIQRIRSHIRKQARRWLRELRAP
jgi:serine/threonine-protein kinase HipA